MQTQSYTNIEISKLLSLSFLFSSLSDSELVEIADTTKIINVSAKKTVFYKGDQGNSMFIVISGRLKVQTVSEEGKTLIMNFLEPNNVFGEISVLDGKPRTATVEAVERSKVLVIDRCHFLKFLEKHPLIAIKLIADFCSKLRITDEFLENMVFMNLATRLAKMLSILAMRYGIATQDGFEIDMKISQGDLANLVGSSRESVNKQLRIWEEEELITSSNDGKMQIHSTLLSLSN